ncbi:MAG TPA: hypothetical protein VF189_04785 [Patescibacteria group bacterium]
MTLENKLGPISIDREKAPYIHTKRPEVISSGEFLLPSGRRMSVVYNPNMRLNTHMQYTFGQNYLTIGNSARENIYNARGGDLPSSLAIRSGIRHEYSHDTYEAILSTHPWLTDKLKELFLRPELYPVWTFFVQRLFEDPIYKEFLRDESTGKHDYRGIQHELFAFAAESEEMRSVCYNLETVRAAKAALDSLKKMDRRMYEQLRVWGVINNKDFKKDYPTIRREMELLIEDRAPKDNSQRQVSRRQLIVDPRSIFVKNK